jgi:dolichol kinase
MMIGNLPLIIPFFTSIIYPVLIATTFIFLTFFTSPYSPFKSIRKRLKGLSDITEEGHHLGLVFYAVSYTLLAFFFAPKPYIIAAGVLPMAYGDSMASIVGERYGKRIYNPSSKKSLEGSATMFFASFFSFLAGLIYFSRFYSFSVLEKLLPALASVMVATLVEGLSPKGVDNLTVPVFSALTFLLLD